MSPTPTTSQTPVVLKLIPALESPRELVITWITGPSRISDSVILEQSLRICISKKVPGYGGTDSPAPALRTTSSWFAAPQWFSTPTVPGGLKKILLPKTPMFRTTSNDSHLIGWNLSLKLWLLIVLDSSHPGFHKPHYFCSAHQFSSLALFYHLQSHLLNLCLFIFCLDTSQTFRIAISVWCSMFTLRPCLQGC